MAYKNEELNQEELKEALLQMKLNINQRLYNEGAITEEMYKKGMQMFLAGH